MSVLFTVRVHENSCLPTTVVENVRLISRKHATGVKTLSQRATQTSAKPNPQIKQNTKMSQI